MLLALTRHVSPFIGDCELTFRTRIPIDAVRAAAQHETYQRALVQAGCRVVALPDELDLPDAVFVEDAAVVLDEVAVILRSGAASRRPEALSVAHALAPYRDVAVIGEPGTLDGGDVLRVGRTLFVGATGRSNEAGIAQLRAVVVPLGYDVRAVPVTGCLHLKSAVTLAAPDTVLINRRWVDAGHFAGLDLLDVHAEEPDAANALLIGSALIYAASHPLTRRKLEDRGIDVLVVDVAEMEKAEGAVTCCSIVFEAPSIAS
jgi:dimethylargininase